MRNVCFSRPRYTGKERDVESGLDYFGARYYSSSMGRWMSPDWSAHEEPVPYAKLDDPQSLNLYGYVGSNPLSKADPDGHEGDDPCWCSLLAGKLERAVGEVGGIIRADARAISSFNPQQALTRATVATGTALITVLSKVTPTPAAPAGTSAIPTTAPAAPQTPAIPAASSGPRTIKVSPD